MESSLVEVVLKLETQRNNDNRGNNRASKRSYK